MFITNMSAFPDTNIFDWLLHDETRVARLQSAVANGFNTTPCTDRNRCACAAEVTLRICRSRCRVGWCDTSTRLFSYCRVQCITVGMTVRCGDCLRSTGTTRRLSAPDLAAD